MIRKSLVAMVVMGAFVGFNGAVWSDDATLNNTKEAVEHPVTTMHQEEANTANSNVQEYAQQKKEAKARMEQAKKDYEQSLKDNGATSSVTKDAKDRLESARKEYRKYARKTATEKKDLQEDSQKVIQDKTAQ